MTAFIANSESSLSLLLGDLREAFREHRYLRGNWSTGRHRSLDQNSIGHAWYEQVANELREDDALGVKRFCKLHFGVPILRAEDAEFREIYDGAIRDHLSYEQKIKAMDILPVTSRMSVQQHSAYLTAVREHYQERGVDLQFPDPPNEKRANHAPKETAAKPHHVPQDNASNAQGNIDG